MFSKCLIKFGKSAKLFTRFMNTQNIKELPTFKSVNEIFDYVNQNKSLLNPTQINKLFNAMFSLENELTLKKLKNARIFITDPEISKFIDKLSVKDLLRLAKRYKQLHIEPDVEWDRLLNLLIPKLNELSSSELYDLFTYTSEIMLADAANVAWEKILPELIKNISEYSVSEVSELLKVISELEFHEDNFWKPVDKYVMEKIHEIRKEDAKEILVSYEYIKREAPEITDKLKEIIFKDFS